MHRLHPSQTPSQLMPALLELLVLTQHLRLVCHLFQGRHFWNALFVQRDVATGASRLREDWFAT